MPYHLSKDETIPDGLRRIVREEVDFALEHLRAKDDEGIHEARKVVKKLRGIVRLLLFDDENIALRDIGRSLSAFRDAAALVETVDALVETAAALGDAAASVRAELVKRRDAVEHKGSQATAVRQAMAALRALKRRAVLWKVNGEGFSVIEPGLRKTYRDGRKALARAKKHPNPVNFHELRKRVKDHWYHVRLLEGLWTDPLEEREARLKDMQEWLGDDHNLVVLYGLMAAEPGAFPDHGEVDALIGKRQRELREDALAAGEILYEKKPRELWAF
jgi:CHAD domain-containing protein